MNRILVMTSNSMQTGDPEYAVLCLRSPALQAQKWAASAWERPEKGEDEKDEAMDVDGEVPDKDPMSDVEAHSDHEPIQMGRRSRAPKLWFK